VILWTYGFCQLLVFDVDRALLSILPESLHWVVVYKFLVFLSLLAVCLTFIRLGRILSWASYVVLYPLTRLAWLILIIVIVVVRLRSWPIIFTSLNLLFSFIGSFKFNFATTVAALVAIVIATLSNDRVYLGFSVLLILGVIAAVIARRFVSLFRPSRIFDVYTTVVAALLGYSRRTFLIEPNTRGRTPDQLTSQQRDKQQTNLQTAIIMAEVCVFLENKFAQYRTSGLPVAYFVLNFFILLGAVIFLLGFASYALFKLDRGAFVVLDAHTYFDFFYYAFATMFLQRLAEISPADFLGKSLWMLQTLLSPVFITMFVTLYFAVKRSVDDTGIEVAIEKLRREHANMGEFVEVEFSVPLDQAIAKLENVQNGLTKIIRALRTAAGAKV
jgi:hypothetical protein